MLNFEPVKDGEEAGLTVYMNERYHYDLAVNLKEGRKVIVFRRTVGSLRTECTRDCAAGPVVLKIEARPDSFFFTVQDQSGELELGSGETHLLSTEVAGGNIIAMYAVSETGQSTTAHFDWFDYIRRFSIYGGSYQVCCLSGNMKDVAQALAWERPLLFFDLAGGTTGCLTRWNLQGRLLQYIHVAR